MIDESLSSKETDRQGGTALPNFELVLPYRFAPRPPSDHTILRKELLRQLTEAALLKQVSLVRGPAGSGKTTLLGQWRDICRDMGRPLAWLTVNAADREPAHFISGLAGALEHAGCVTRATGFRMVAASAQKQPILLAQSLATICNEAREQVVIVLDQYEDMDSPDVGEIVNGLLQHTLTLRIVIATRLRPMLALGSLRARDQLFEITPSELNLTPLETRLIFSEDVPELYTRRLHIETSGEPVAIGFARRVMDELPHDMMRADSWQEALHEYYRDEMLVVLSDDLRAAMSRLVVVEGFDLSLATALIGGAAADVIERLHYFDGLLLRHRGGQEYYFSEMLRRFLVTRLAQIDEGERSSLHKRAAAWFAAQGRDSEALRHAVLAGDREHGRMLLNRIGYVNLVAQHGVSGAHNLHDSLGISSDSLSAATLLSLALIHAHERDVPTAARLIERAKAQMADQDVDPDTDGHRILAEAYVAGLRDETIRSGTGPELEAYLASLPENDHDNRAQTYVLLSWDRFCRGDVLGAEALTTEAAREYAETESVYGCIFMHVHRALARYWLNDLDQALDDILLAERMSRIFFTEDRRARLMTGILRAGLLAEMDRPDPLMDLTAVVGTVAAIESWSEVQIWAHVHSARTAADRGRPNEARAILAHGLEVSKRLNLPRLGWTTQLAAIDIALTSGEIDDAMRLADALLLPEGLFLATADERLLWIERIGGLLMAIRVAEARDDLDQADRLCDLARNLIAGTSAVRMSTELELAVGRIAARRGDLSAAQGHTQAALAYCRAGMPMRLFRDQGALLLDHMPPGAARVPAPSVRAGAGAEKATTEQEAGTFDPLTARERQILLVMGEGFPNKVAAYRLQLSEATVKFHLRNAYRKLQAQNRTQALARYRQLIER